MNTIADRGGAKWDKAARYLRIAMLLNDHPDGLSAQELADRIGVSKRTVYRDLDAMDSTRGCRSGRTRASSAWRAARSCRRWR